MTKPDWCPGGKKQLEWTGPEREKPRKVRCEECGRLLSIRQEDCHDGTLSPPCWHSWVPAHKRKRKYTKRPSKRQEKQPRGR